MAAVRKNLKVQEIGKSNIIKSQLVPIISYTGTLVELPEKVEKELTALIFKFLWGSSTDKITRALSHQERKYGGLGIPHIKARLEAYKATWIFKMQSTEKKLWHMCFDSGINWTRDGAIDALLPTPSDGSYSAECIQAWNGLVAILAPQNDDTQISKFLTVKN